ncbi:acetolactate synthase small subunit [Clostridium tarantellae]|uniref:Acetolactate synthase small subunit n=1 Tax=Clostridium tarantellae TaxID=39493 RepID=A0A6I1MJI7_9CLOT|nr:acetolactate synthase small subunit [Clostridium tarantellae]MPQ42312.1 acetolactate synthase small subunit [Clostridium tarantellae]
MDKHFLSVLVKNSSGVLSRISGLFSRRGFNIDSITAGRTQNQSISRMTIALMGNDEVLEQFIKQLNKLEDVIKIIKTKANESVYRELVLVKVNANSEQRASINEIVNIFRCKVVDISKETMTIELTGDESKVNALISLVNEFGIKEIARTGIIALERGDIDINSYDEFFGVEY